MQARQIEQLVRIIVHAIQSDTSLLNVGMDVPVGVSARHIHLCRQDVDTLFGKGHTLSIKAELMGGQFAAFETCTIVGSKLVAIENARVLGPLRDRSQVEISMTDNIRLGVGAPVRGSGDLTGAAAITVVGSHGSVYLPEGCIVAARHLHMSPVDAAKMGLIDGDTVYAHAPGSRGMLMRNIKVRIHATYTLEMHIDTDEANACGLSTGDMVRIAKEG